MVAAFFISLFVLIFIGVPVGFSLGLATVLGIIIHPTLPLDVVPQRIFGSLDSFPLMAIPFFILAGNLMGAGGISKRLVNFASSLVGHFNGGLAMVAIVTSMFFAAISGSGAATTAAIGSILIPAMVARGYNIDYTSANQAVAGALGIIIPPSIPMILYGVTASVSIGDLFLAGILPGLFITLSLLTSAYIVAKRNDYGKEERQDFPSIFKAFRKSILALLMPIIVLGGIYTGIFTPTEASVVAAVYSLLVSMLIYRSINLKDLAKVFKSSAINTAIIMIVIGSAGLFGFFISVNNITDAVTLFIDTYVDNKFVFLFVVNIIFFLIGMFLEAGAAILILVPLLLGSAIQFGIDPVHFGIIMITNLAIGLVTPPVGIDLFVVSQIAKVDIFRVGKAAIPLILVLIFNVLVISYLPQLSLFLPSLFE